MNCAENNAGVVPCRCHCGLLDSARYCWNVLVVVFSVCSVGFSVVFSVASTQASSGVSSTASKEPPGKNDDASGEFVGKGYGCKQWRILS